jgi:hypothetical protein
MPKQIINYENTIIYKIVCNDLNIKAAYVSYTTNFNKRKAQHKRACNNPKGEYYYTSLYNTIRKHGGWNNWSMIEIEKFKCNDRNEARARDRIFYEQLNANLNLVQLDKDGEIIYKNISEQGKNNTKTL